MRYTIHHDPSRAHPWRIAEWVAGKHRSFWRFLPHARYSSAEAARYAFGYLLLNGRLPSASEAAAHSVSARHEHMQHAQIGTEITCLRGHSHKSCRIIQRRSKRQPYMIQIRYGRAENWANLKGVNTMDAAQEALEFALRTDGVPISTNELRSAAMERRIAAGYRPPRRKS